MNKSFNSYLGSSDQGNFFFLHFLHFFFFTFFILHFFIKKAYSIYDGNKVTKFFFFF